MSDAKAMAKMLRVAPVPFTCPRELSLLDAWKGKLAEVQAECDTLLSVPRGETFEATGMGAQTVKSENVERLVVLDVQLGQCAGEITRLEADLVTAEIHRLSYREQWEVDRYSAEARSASEDMSRKARIEFIAQVNLQARAFVLLRTPGSEGKTRMFTEDELAGIDLALASKAVEAYDEAFRLRKDESPKAEAPR